jgi:uncharacterized protein (DUF2141 family)
VRNSKGVIGVLVFESARGWTEDTSAAFRRAAVPAHQGSTTVLIPNLPPGDYGVVVLHATTDTSYPTGYHNLNVGAWRFAYVRLMQQAA